MVATEQEIRAEAALRAIKLGSSVRAAAKRFAVPRSYLQRRIQGIPTRKEVNRDLQSLSPYLERQLSIWAIGQARLGYALSLVKFQAIAQMMLRASGSSKVLGDK
ncbi:hypothetical protein F5B18DRAFT_151921 [Nemania serpens]|nr:hypothetical protein F5B18DRAFT_151921 [Nemania serpens]